MTVQTESHTRLHGRWLLIARLAWLAVFITLTAMYAFGFLAVHETLSTICEEEPCALGQQVRRTDAGEQIVRSAGPTVGYADRLHPDQVQALATLGVTLDQYGWLGALQLGLPALVLLLIAAGLFWWKSDDWMVLFASLMVATFPVHNTPLAFTLAAHQPAWEWIGNSVGVIALSCLLIFPLLFPTGRFVPRWTRWLAIYDVAGAVIGSFLGSAILEVFGSVFGAALIGIVVLLPFGIGVYAQLYRYFRMAGPAERQQFKWVVVGFVGAVFIQFAVSIPADVLLNSGVVSADPAQALVLSAIPDILWQVSILLIPVCITISVLRYRLWDIDILISRTLVYFTLIAVITGLYVLVVGSLGGLLQNQNELAAPLVALVIIAAFVQPLRRALQNNVNRLLRFDPVRHAESQDALQSSSELADEAQKENLPFPAISEIDSSTHTRLHGIWLLIARLAWAAGFVTLTAMYTFGFMEVREALSTVCEQEPCTLLQQIRHTEAGEQVMSWQGPPSGFADPLRPDQVEALKRLGLTLDQYGWLGALQMGIPVLVYLLIAVGLFWRKSDDWMVLLVSTMIATFPLGLWPMPYTLAVRQPIWQWVHTPVNFVAVSSFFIFPLVFPTGRFVPRWTRWRIFFDIAFAVIVTLWGNSILTIPPGAEDLEYLYIVLLLSINAYALSYRYFRVANPLERQQIKWVVAGLLGFVIIAVPLDPLAVSLSANTDLARGLVLSAILDTLFQVIALFIPISIAISVLRYRLWDIDIIINRTLVYGALTTSVVALYVLIVGWSSIGLQTQNNLAGSVFAILVIAFLLRPLRQRLQRIADRFVPLPQTALPMEQHKYQIAIPESQGTADTTLRGRWFFIARLAWVIGLITLTAMYAFGFLAVREALSTVCKEETCTLRQGWPGPPIGYADPLRPDQIEVLERLGLTLNEYGWLGALQMGLPLLMYLLIAAGLFWRKSHDWMVLLVSVMVATIPIANIPLPFILAVRQPAWQWVNGAAGLVSLSLFLIFPLIFPNGRFVPRWTRWMVFFDIAFAVIATFFGNSISGNPGAENLVVAYLLTAFGTGIYAQLYRYFRVANPLERQQLKWVVVGLAGFISIAFAVLLPLDARLTSLLADMDPARALLLSVIPDSLFQVILLFIPVSIAISVLRYRLWDIDLLINRTLVYGALTGIVVSAFVILVGFLSILFQSSGNSVIAILATGLVALLFNPLRQRLQRGVNRLMYGERDEPYTALSRLGRRLETTLAPESVLPTVVTTVRDVLRLPYVAIYLQQDSHGYKIVAEAASPLLPIENGRIRVPGMNREGRCIPLIHQRETVGYIVLGPRAPNEAFSTTDMHLLQDLAPQVGVAVHAVRLTADLQRSREQLVLAREEERRRLRRDLHDDLAPTLASLGLTASTVADLIATNPETAEALIKELHTELRATVGNIRRLVYDLRPPTLDELGLLAAVRERAAQYSNAPNGVQVTVEASAPLPVLPAAVEVAAYRIVQEALENVSKHSKARKCVIRFMNHNGLEIEITDDGIGLPPHIVPGVGLRSMRERTEELGGSCVVESNKSSGTRVLACLPIGELDGTFAHPDRG